MFGPNWHRYYPPPGTVFSDGGFREEPETENHGYAHIEYSNEYNGFVRSVEMRFDVNARLGDIIFLVEKE